MNEKINEIKWVGDNPRLLCQDCSTPLFRWFLSRVDWVRILREQGRAQA